MKSTWCITVVCSVACGLVGEPLFANGGHGGGAAAAGSGHVGTGNGGQHFSGNSAHGFQSPAGAAGQLNSSPGVRNSTSAVQNSISGAARHLGFDHGGANGVQSQMTIGSGIQHRILHEPTANFGNGEGNFGSFSSGGQSPTGHLPMGAGRLHFDSNSTASFPSGSSLNSQQHHHHLGHSGSAPGHRHGNWINGTVTTGITNGGTTHHSSNAQFSSQPFFWGSNTGGSGGWGQGSLIYGSGYLGYLNPYYSSMDLSGAYNYTQPILVANNNAQVAATPTSNMVQAIVNSAVAAFLRSDYETALLIANRGIDTYPDEAVLHEFRALVLFAKGDYQDAAATIHAVLAVGPGWDWTTLISLYRDVSVYTAQLRALEGTVKQNPTDGAIRFLLAYHYMAEGYPDAAARILRRVVDLVPNDQVAANLLKMVSGSPAQATIAPVAQPTPDAPTTESPPATGPVTPAQIVGTWNATRDDGSKFSLTLTEDQRFTWTFAPKQLPPESFEGTYSLDNNLISLASRGRGSLNATLNISAEGRFNFKAVGAPNHDPGLDFHLANGQ